MSQPIQALLLATARPHAVARAERAQLATALGQLDETGWSTLIERALLHGTASLLCCNLLAVDADLLPADVAAACNTYLMAREQAAAEAMAQLAAVIDALEARNIAALPYKGPSSHCKPMAIRPSAHHATSIS